MSKARLTVPPLRRVLAAVLFAALTLVPAAHAAYEPLGAGTTKLRLDRSFLAVLKKHGVTVRVKAGATYAHGTLAFPVAEGKLDPTTGEGTVSHGGTVVFAGHRRSVSFKALQLKTTRKSSPLALKLGGGQLKLGRPRRSDVVRKGFGATATVAQIALSGKVATRLDKRLRLPGAFVAGMPLGSATATLEPETVSLLGRGSLQLELDPGFSAKLGELHVAANPIFPAEHPGAFVFPLFGGAIAPDLSTGSLQTSGGFELLQLGGGQVFWEEPTVNLDSGVLEPAVEIKPSPPYAGKLGAQAVGALDLAAGSAAADPRSRTISLSGTPLLLDAAAAQSFEETFAKPQGREGVFAAGEVVGQVSFAAQGE